MCALPCTVGYLVITCTPSYCGRRLLGEGYLTGKRFPNDPRAFLLTRTVFAVRSSVSFAFGSSLTFILACVVRRSGWFRSCQSEFCGELAILAMTRNAVLLVGGRVVVGAGQGPLDHSNVIKRAIARAVVGILTTKIHSAYVAPTARRMKDCHIWITLDARPCP